MKNHASSNINDSFSKATHNTRHTEQITKTQNKENHPSQDQINYSQPNSHFTSKKKNNDLLESHGARHTFVIDTQIIETKGRESVSSQVYGSNQKIHREISRERFSADKSLAKCSHTGECLRKSSKDPKCLKDVFYEECDLGAYMSLTKFLIFSEKYGELFSIKDGGSKEVFEKADTMNRGKVTFLDIQLATNI